MSWWSFKRVRTFALEFCFASICSNSSTCSMYKRAFLWIPFLCWVIHSLTVASLWWHKRGVALLGVGDTAKGCMVSVVIPHKGTWGTSLSLMSLRQGAPTPHESTRFECYSHLSATQFMSKNHLGQRHCVLLCLAVPCDDRQAGQLDFSSGWKWAAYISVVNHVCKHT